MICLHFHMKKIFLIEIRTSTKNYVVPKIAAVISAPQFELCQLQKMSAKEVETPIKWEIQHIAINC